MPRKSLLAATLALAMAGALPAQAQDIGLVRTIALAGHGEVKVTPDMALITVGVLSQSATAGEALAENTKAMNAVMAAIKAAGIESNNVQTSNLSIASRYDYGNNGQAPKLAGYEVSNNVTITVRRLSSLGGLLDQLVKAGSNQVQGIAFQLSKPTAALDEARRLATEDAMRKARVYAQMLNLRLGPVTSINEGVNDFQPPPVPMKTTRAEMSSDVPVAEGEQTLSVDVNITWELR